MQPDLGTGGTHPDRRPDGVLIARPVVPDHSVSRLLCSRRRCSAGNTCTTTRSSASSRCSILKPTSSARAITSSSRRSRSARAVCSARAGSTVRRAQLDFLPARSTDFIFAVVGEEFGLIGLVGLLGLYLFVIARSVWLADSDQRHVLEAARTQPGADLLRVRVHQRGHGERSAPGGRGSSAARELRRYLGRDPAGGLRYPHGTLFASQAGWLLGGVAAGTGRSGCK